MSSSPSKRIILLGGGGHCKVILDVLEAMGGYHVYGISDLRERQGSPVLSKYRVSLLDSDLESLAPDVGYAFVSHGEDLQLRRRLYEMARSVGYSLPVLTSPSAYVSAHAQLGDGTFTMHRATINPAAMVGSNVIINTGAIVEHDCVVGAHSHIAPGAVLCGSVRVGEMTLVGANSVIIPGLRVGDNVLIGAGSVVVRDVPDNVLVAGNPARIVRTRSCA